MTRILDLTQNDLRQLLRDKQTFLFLLIMPVIFTVLFGLAFGGFSKGEEDPRLPVGFVDQDQGRLSTELKNLLSSSTVVRLVEDQSADLAALEKQVAKGDLAGLIVVPTGYSTAAEAGAPVPLEVVADTTTTTGMSVQSAALSAANRIASVAQVARVVTQNIAGATLAGAEQQALAAWQESPVQIQETTRQAPAAEESANISSLAHTSPGMMIQFAIAGLLTAGQIIVSERKNRCFQRMLTTATSRGQILAGHFLAIFVLIFCQFVLLIAFGQFILGVDYLRQPLATLLVALTTALCIAAMGLLIGVMAKSEEQAIIFSLIPMFVLSALGGAWVPLEQTGASFQTIGHISPVAWALDGFKDIIVRGLGFESILLPSLALLGYAVLFLALSGWRMARVEG